MMTKPDPHYDRLRQRATRRGYSLKKCRRVLSLQNFGQYQLVQSSTDTVVIGSRYDASLEEVEHFLTEA